MVSWELSGSAVPAGMEAICSFRGRGGGGMRTEGMLGSLGLNLSSNRWRCIVDLDWRLPPGPQRVQVQRCWSSMLEVKQRARGRPTFKRSINKGMGVGMKEANDA